MVEAKKVIKTCWSCLDGHEHLTETAAAKCIAKREAQHERESARAAKREASIDAKTARLAVVSASWAWVARELAAMAQNPLTVAHLEQAAELSRNYET